MTSSVATKTKGGGYTLIELMVSLAVLGIIIVGIFELYTSMRQTWLDEEKKAAAQQEARIAMDNMVRELMMMGYGSDTKILTAKADEIRFEESVMNSAGTAYDNWRITYKLQGENLVRSSITRPDDEAGLPETVRTMMEKVKALDFEYYYKDEGTEHNVADFQVPWDEGVSEITDTPQVNRNLIRRVKMKLVVASGAKNPDGTDKTITLTADISPRNMWEGEASMDDDPPVFTNSSGVEVTTVPWIKIRDTEQCDKMKVQWAKCDSSDLAGYLVKYGQTSGTWTNVKDVPVSAVGAGDPWTYLTDGIYLSPYDAEGINVIKYYVTVQAYDRSYNYTPEGTPVGGDDPDTSNTSFDVAVSDATNTIPKPAAPANLSVFNNNTTTGELKLTWTASGDPNVRGYRIYRDTSAITTFPVPESKLIASETGSLGNALTAATAEYLDDDDALVGCTTYFYAICAVTCDTTRIHGFGDATKDATRGGIYAESNYATGYAESKEKVKPSTPAISARPGWHRVFLNVVFPVGDDYDHTKIFWGKGALDVTVTDQSPLIIDRQTFSLGDRPELQGVFYDWGSSTANGITFNSEASEDPDPPDSAEPTLENNMVYSFLAVAYDKCGNKSDTVAGVATTSAKLCGDEACGPPILPAGADAFVNPVTTTLDTSVWVRQDTTNDSNAEITSMGLVWTPVEGKGDYLNDFGAYVVTLEDNPPLSTPVLYTISETCWDENIVSSSSLGKPLLEGAAYDYIVQATDCPWQNIGDNDTLECPEIPGVPHDKTYIKEHNITPWADAMRVDNVRPGRFRQYRSTTDTAAAENFVYASGEFYNTVNFYIQNTSKSELYLDNLAVKWDGADTRGIKLSTINIYNSAGTPLVSKSVNAGSGVPSGMDGVYITDKATGPGAYSTPMLVQLVFVNNDAPAISTNTDMRESNIGWEMKFRNESMPIMGGGYAGPFTTGDVTTRPREFRVSGGPRVNSVVQNKPANPTTPTKATKLTTLPASFNKVDGGIPVTVTANVTKPTDETLSNVTISYYVTEPADTDPLAGTAGTVEMTQTGGNTYTGTIPSTIDKAVWYKVVATSAQGTVASAPPLDAEYYYYRSNPFDVCFVTPEAPTNLTATTSFTDVTLDWAAPTAYTNGLNKLAADTFVYDVYRRLPTGSYPSVPFVAGVADTSYTTPIGAITYVYAVKARNACDDPIILNDSEFSNEALVCVGSACTVVVSPSSAETDTNWTTGSSTASIISGNLSVTICNRAGDGNLWSPPAGNTALSDITMTVSATTGSGNVFHITLYEIGDTGVFTMTGTSDSTVYFYPLATPAYNNTWKNTTPATTIAQRTFPVTLKTVPEDTLTFTTDSGITDCVLQGSSLAFTTSPCANTPARPTISYVRRVDTGSAKSVTVKCNIITRNTDGSPATTARDSVSYELWYSGTDPADTFALLPGTTFTTDTATGKVTITGPGLGAQSKNIYVKVVDNCSPTPNTNASGVVTVASGGTYGSP